LLISVAANPAPVRVLGAAWHCRKIATRAEEKAFNLRSVLKGNLCRC
jgi:hypothetical protein